MKTKTWTFTDGVETIPCDTFPYAFRTMHARTEKAIASKQAPGDVKKRVRITSPEGKIYTYAKATDLATNMGLLTHEGINRREFKRR